MVFADKLKELRKTRKMTQEELASEIYVSRPMIAKYETGKAYPTNEILQRIADFFEISVEELVQREELIDEHSKVLEETLSNNQKIVTLVAVVGILLLAIVAILSVIEIETVTTEVDLVQIRFDPEWGRWDLFYYEESNLNIWTKRAHLYLSEFEQFDNSLIQFTIEGGDFFEKYNEYDISEDYHELKTATLYYKVTVRRNLLGIVQGKGYFLEEVDFHLGDEYASQIPEPHRI